MNKKVNFSQFAAHFEKVLVVLQNFRIISGVCSIKWTIEKINNHLVGVL